MSAEYVARRFFQVLPAVGAIVLLSFLLVHLAPGDPIDVLASEGGSPEYLDSLRRDYGLDRPLPQQLVAYAGNVVTGDFGKSIVKGESVTSVIGSRLQPTLLLTLSALILSTAGAIALGKLAARRPYGWLDRAIGTTTLVVYAIPVFWLAQIVILTVALQTGWFPVQGFTDARAQYAGIDRWIDIAHHMVLPALVMAASEVALLARVTRAGVLKELGTDYVRTARSKGVSSQAVVASHALRNALLPVITIVGARVGFVFSGAVLVENVFAWPGLGTLLVESARSQDHPVLLAMVLLVALSVVIANLITDLVYAWVDPRVRLS